MEKSTGGNLSMRLQEDLFLVKPSGIALFDLQEEDLLVTDAFGMPLEGTRKPTKEINTHLGIYKIRQDVGGIVHYHPTFATTYAVCRKEIPLKTVHARRIPATSPLFPLIWKGVRRGQTLFKVYSWTSRFGRHFCSIMGIIATGAHSHKPPDLAELVEESARDSLFQPCFYLSPRDRSNLNEYQFPQLES